MFAIRWDKGSKSGYMPAYSYDRFRYRAHKMKGGTLKDFADKHLTSLSDEQFVQHIKGKQHIGLYPLLPDNTSWFIAADFDKGEWLSSARRFLRICADKGIPAYLERSRSGNGGHVWIFFEGPYPAYKSRKIVMSLLVESGAVSAYDKNTGFDRLFPNQDRHSGQGFGNLIALPLNGLRLKEQNSCFLDPATAVPYPDQWLFLGQIERTSQLILDQLYSNQNMGNRKDVASEESVSIRLSEYIRLQRVSIPPILFDFIKNEVNFLNQDFLIKKKAGRNTFGTERYFQLIQDEGDYLFLPRGFIGSLIRFCREQSIPYTFHDERKNLTIVRFSFQASLRPYQEESVEATRKKEMGVIVAPPGSGKTVIALKIIAEKQQPALIIVHRQDLARQWSERIEAFLGIPLKDIGKIGKGKANPGKQVTVATIQSLAKLEIPELYGTFGLVIVDECHHIPADTFRNTVARFNSRYLYGLTATPFRKYNDGKLIFIHLGELIAKVRMDALPGTNHPTIVIRNTQLEVPFEPKTDRFETLSKILVHDSERNKLIVKDILEEIGSGRKAVVLTERKEHIESLEQLLKRSCEIVKLSGEDSESSRQAKWKLLKDGNYQVLITTGQLFGEGTDLQNANCLFLVYPFSFEGKLVQYIGRVQRSEVSPTIYDYRDIRIGYLNRMFLKRNVYYRKLEKQRSLFDIPESDEIRVEDTGSREDVIEKSIKVKIEDLEFLYGGFRFSHRIPEQTEEVLFEIENLNIRPEFEVLKPYFEKLLKNKSVDVQLTIILDRRKQLIALSAESEDLAKINRETIEGVRLRFVENLFRSKGKLPVQEELRQTISSGDGTTPLYQSGEELLADVLEKGNYRHRRQLQYLAGLHEGNVLKIRFVLHPFSFVFLLSGESQYHVVMETLDTEEATYIWHFPKSIPALKQGVLEIEKQLGEIRTGGRQLFLQAKPENFSRVLHDYTDERKGFVVWKDSLEERLW